jgi:hypothetical protein
MSRACIVASLLFATALVVIGADDDGDVLVLDADNFDREVKTSFCQEMNTPCS